MGGDVRERVVEFLVCHLVFGESVALWCGWVKTLSGVMFLLLVVNRGKRSNLTFVFFFFMAYLIVFCIMFTWCEHSTCTRMGGRQGLGELAG